MKTFFTLALSGLDEADARLAIQTLESPKLGQWSLSEGSNSDLLIIDVDSVWGHMDWVRALAEGRRCAAYTQEASMRDCELLLRKPLDGEALVDMLRQVQGLDTQAAPAPSPGHGKSTPHDGASSPAPELVTAHHPAHARATAETSEPVPHPAPATPETAREVKQAPAAEPATVASMLLAGDLDVSVLVEDASAGLGLHIDPARGQYRAAPQLKPLQALLELPASRLEPVDADDPKVSHVGPEQPLVRLLWYAALCASDGRLAPHLDPEAAWKLTRWPQIEREFPRHFRIATAMMKQAGTVDEIATAAKSPVEDVAGFINAYYVAGYVAIDGAEAPTGDASAATVLSRLRRSFSKADHQAAS